MAAHLVIPGQVIATSSSNGDDGDGGDNDTGGSTSFLRGHGTFVEHDTARQQDRLVASVCGVVQRVNQLITVIPYGETTYTGNVGDLVVGQITMVGTSSWRVQLVPQLRDANLPLSGVHLPGGVQRVRTAHDARQMSQFLKVGDWISAEVHKVQPADGSLSLHTRSFRYTKLENGCWIRVPSALIPRRKNHYTTMINDTLDVLWGTNGVVWIQRTMKEQEQHTTRGGGTAADSISQDLMADLQEQIRHSHATTPISKDVRTSVARLRNCIECLRLVHVMITPERVESLYQQSLESNLSPSQILWPDNVIRLTQEPRRDDATAGRR
jgi:exosome complex component RRP4